MIRTRAARILREQEYGRGVLSSEERNWGWATPAGRIRHVRRAEFLSSIPLPADSRVLEIGCGTGTFTASLAGRFRRLIAVDISAELLAVARRRVPGATFVQMDAHDMPFRDSSFDAVVGVSVLHHLDWALALRNLRRLLRPEGWIRFSEPNLANPQVFLQKSIPILKRLAGDSPDEYAFTRSEARRCLESSGFSAITVRPFEFLHPGVPAWGIPLVTKLESVAMRTPLAFIAGSILIEARAGG
jgi:ubiquinone/menaquinone biosynthesis C-methylase UbiE